MFPRKTRSAAQLIGCTLPALRSAIACGKLAPPGKDESGDFLWQAEDIERAKRILAIDLRKHREVVHA
jgi:hypothetical protein